MAQQSRRENLVQDREGPARTVTVPLPLRTPPGVPMVSGFCRWKSLIRVGSRMKRDGTQHLSSGPYPSQSTRYCSPLPLLRTLSSLRESLSPIHDPRGRRGFGGGIKWARGHRSQLRDMEGWVNPLHGPGSFQFNSGRVNDLGDGKRAHKPGRQFL